MFAIKLIYSDDTNHNAEGFLVEVPTYDATSTVLVPRVNPLHPATFPTRDEAVYEFNHWYDRNNLRCYVSKWEVVKV